MASLRVYTSQQISKMHVPVQLLMENRNFMASIDGLRDASNGGPSVLAGAEKTMNHIRLTNGNGRKMKLMDAIIFGILPAMLGATIITATLFVDPGWVSR